MYDDNCATFIPMSDEDIRKAMDQQDAIEREERDLRL